jgi:PDZ domain-containing secreted protein
MTDTNGPIDQGIPITKLLEIIGKQAVEWIVNEEVGLKVKEQYVAMANKLSVAMAELAALKAKGAEPAPELEQLRKVNLTDDARIKQLETQVHVVALERDARSAEKDIADAALKKASDDYLTLQYTCDDLQKQIDALTAKKGKKK